MRGRSSRKVRGCGSTTQEWLLDQGRAADARPEIDEALKLDPALKEAQKVQALIAWHLRNLAAAETILEPLHRDAPADFAVANLLALALIEQDDAAKQSRGLQLADVNALQVPTLRRSRRHARLGALPRGKLDQAEQKLCAAVTAAAPHPISPTSSPECWSTKTRPTTLASCFNPPRTCPALSLTVTTRTRYSRS